MISIDRIIISINTNIESTLRTRQKTELIRKKFLNFKILLSMLVIINNIDLR